MDESTPTRRAPPAGVLGAEVLVKLVDADSPAPTDPAALMFQIMTTKLSFRAEFKVGEGGKTAVYMAHWVNTRGEKGPWSEVTTATVAAARLHLSTPLFLLFAVHVRDLRTEHRRTEFGPNAPPGTRSC